MKKLIPFYVKAGRNQMGYSLFVDMNTMKIYRAYNDNYKFFNSARYYAYFYGGYWILSRITNMPIHFTTLIGMLAFIGLGGATFIFVYGPFYNQQLEKSELKNVYLDQDEFVSYIKKGSANTWFTLGVLGVVGMIGVPFLIVYFFETTLEILIILLLGMFLLSALMRSVPFTRLRLQFSKSYREKIAAAVHEEMLYGDKEA